MASRHKRTGRGGAPPTGGRQEVERLIAKLRLKDAVHEAKLCYKSEGTPENHRLLERAYMLRALQLHRNGMPEGAREVTQHLIDFGVTDPELVEETARLLRALGMPRHALALEGGLEAPEAQEKLARQELDAAVLHPHRSFESSPEVLAGAALVRSSLEALHAGDEARALESLRDVARSSPVSDWRLFVRGLAAFSRHEVEDARASWARLDADRAGARIARTLLTLRDNQAGAPAATNLVALERIVFGEPVLDRLDLLRKEMSEGNWEGAIRHLGWLRLRLRRIDPKLAERLSSVLIHPLLRTTSDLDYDEALTLVEAFTRAAEPLDIDPRWNRLRALVWDGPAGTFDDMEESWQLYVKDLETVTCLAPQERTLAQALVWKHLGEGFLAHAEMATQSTCNCPNCERNRREADGLQAQAIAWLKESLRLCPDHRDTHRALIEAYRARGRPEDAAAAARRLLEVDANDFPAVALLLDHHYQRDELEPALEYALRARALKPLDVTTARNEWAVHVARTRWLAIQERWDEGRAEFAAAELASPADSRMLHYQARRALFELKAGQTERAEALINDLQESLADPAPLWLALFIESTRLLLPQAVRDRFEARWTNAQPRKVHSASAGALADLMTVCLDGKFADAGRDTHLDQVVDYLARTTRIKYRLADLKRVCTLLRRLPKQQPLLKKLVDRGRKLFPGAPVFHLWAGELEPVIGRLRGQSLTRARESFEKALALAEQSTDPADRKLVPEIQKQLSQTSDMHSGPTGLPFGWPGGAPAGLPRSDAEFASVIDAMARAMGIDPTRFSEDDVADFGDDFFEDDEQPRSGPVPRRPPVPGRRQRKRR
jgi:tetratricopeptide (TPR) repeat protein